MEREIGDSNQAKNVPVVDDDEKDSQAAAGSANDLQEQQETMAVAKSHCNKKQEEPLSLLPTKLGDFQQYFSRQFAFHGRDVQSFGNSEAVKEHLHALSGMKQFSSVVFIQLQGQPRQILLAICRDRLSNDCAGFSIRKETRQVASPCEACHKIKKKQKRHEQRNAACGEKRKDPPPSVPNCFLPTESKDAKLSKQAKTIQSLREKVKRLESFKKAMERNPEIRDGDENFQTKLEEVLEFCAKDDNFRHHG